MRGRDRRNLKAVLTSSGSGSIRREYDGIIIFMGEY
jgi:hypothetical protein